MIKGASQFLVYTLFVCSGCHVNTSSIAAPSQTITASSVMGLSGFSGAESRKICATNDGNIILVTSAANFGSGTFGLASGVNIATSLGRSSLVTKYDANLNLKNYQSLLSHGSNSHVHFNFCAAEASSTTNLITGGYIHGNVTSGNKQIYNTEIDATYGYPFLATLNKNMEIVQSHVFDDGIAGNSVGQMQAFHQDKTKLTLLFYLQGYLPDSQIPRSPGANDDLILGEFDLVKDKFNWSLTISGANGEYAQHAPLIKTKDGGWLLHVLSNSNILYVGNQEIKRPSSISSDRYVNYIIKLNKNLRIDWSYTMKGDTARTFNIRDIVEDKDGFVFDFNANFAFSFGGNTITPIGSGDVFLFKLNQKGDEEWLKQFGSTGNDSAGLHPLSIDNTGNLYFILSFAQTLQTPSELSGLTLSSGATSNNLLLKIGPSGNIMTSLQISSTTATQPTLELINEQLYIYGIYTGRVTVSNYDSGTLPYSSGILLKVKL